MKSKTFKDAMERFEAPTVENDFPRLNMKTISDQTKFALNANRANAYFKVNGIPPGYKRSQKIYKNLMSHENAAINFEDLYALDAAISQTIWDSNTFGKLPIPTQVLAKPRWQIKDYLVQSEEWPRLTTKYRNPIFIRIKESSQFTNGIGLHMGISIPFTEIHESGGALWSPQAIAMQELAAKFGLMKSRVGFLGSSCENAYGDDGSDASGYGITGLYNYGSAQTFQGGIGGDENMQDQGDIEFTLRAAMDLMKKVYQPGQVWVLSSAGIASHLFYERDTYQQDLDYKRVKEFMNNVGLGGVIAGWIVTEHLFGSTALATDQRMAVVKIGTGLINKKLIYPQQMLPMANKMYEGDIMENMIWGGALQIKKVDTTNNAVPIATIAASAGATPLTDGTGFIPEGTRIY